MAFAHLRPEGGLPPVPPPPASSGPVPRVERPRAPCPANVRLSSPPFDGARGRFVGCFLVRAERP